MGDGTLGFLWQRQAQCRAGDTVRNHDGSARCPKIRNEAGVVTAWRTRVREQKPQVSKTLEPRECHSSRCPRPEVILVSRTRCTVEPGPTPAICEVWTPDQQR